MHLLAQPPNSRLTLPDTAGKSFSALICAKIGAETAHAMSAVGSQLVLVQGRYLYTNTIYGLSVEDGASKV